ncbi:MAG: arsenate reductase ArsC [bacterium]|nr:arsenate reductase ArsC [bacterium]
MASILFICTGNTCRSPMAERLARHACPQHEWHSAGVRPEVTMHPLAARVVAERGASADDFFSQHPGDLDLASYDAVVLIGDSAQRLVPATPEHVQRLHWDIPDPIEATGTEDERLAEYRRTADVLMQHINALVAELT